MEGWDSVVGELARMWESSEWLGMATTVAIPILAWSLRRPLADLLISLAKLLAKGLQIEFSERLVESIVPSARVLIVAFGVLVAHDLLRLPEPYFGLVERILLSVCAAALFASMYRLCDLLSDFIRKHSFSRAPDQSTWVVRVSKFIVFFVGVAAVLKIWSIDVGPVLAGMGLAGAAVALAAQDYLSNLIAGFNNLTERRFSEGDWIRVEGLVDGTVESVDLRSTLIRRFDKAPVHVPNGQLASRALINFSRRPHRRIVWRIGLKYETSVDRLRAVRDRIEAFIDESDLFVDPDQATRLVRLDGLGESSVELLVYCFTRSVVWADYLEAREALLLELKTIVEQEGSAFAFPSRSLYIEPMVDAAAVDPFASDTFPSSESTSSERLDQPAAVGPRDR